MAQCSVNSSQDQVGVRWVAVQCPDLSDFHTAIRASSSRRVGKADLPSRRCVLRRESEDSVAASDLSPRAAPLAPHATEHRFNVGLAPAAWPGSEAAAAQLPTALSHLASDCDPRKRAAARAGSAGRSDWSGGQSRFQRGLRVDMAGPLRRVANASGQLAISA